MEEFYRQKKARAIGVSNYCKACLRCLTRNSTVRPRPPTARVLRPAGLFARTAGAARRPCTPFGR
jgi:hypothetical protein